MSKENQTTIHWLATAEEHTYQAAESYLSLIYPADRTAEMVAQLRQAAVVQFKAKDIFRASRLLLLEKSNSHVQKDVDKITKGVQLSPLLLVRDGQNGQVVIADGYHRMCAIYGFDEDAWICCQII